MISLPIKTDKPAQPGNKLTTGECFSILTILILVALVYCPVLTNAFVGDDFVHLSWLHQAINQPSLIWRNFHSSWLDITTAQFYRPLISIFMVGDYLAWHNNGIGFHLTNLFCHLGNTFLLWLVLRALVTDNGQPISLNHHIWCSASAALFGLYPLHPEAVSWITGRVDTFVTLFSLLTILAYIYWRQSHKYKWLFLSILAMICGLLSKEMAIILPAVLCAYELCFASDKSDFPIRIISSLKQTGLFWLILLFYFVLRYYSLGTLIGGYDNTLFAFANCKQLLKMWLYSSYILLFPFNQTILGKHNPVIILWASVLGMSVVCSLKYIFFNQPKPKKDTTIFVFLILWLVLNLVPVYKLFNISNDLQGSRLAYLATVPLCALFCFGFANLTKENNKIRYWTLFALTAMLSAAGATLLINNSAWIKAETVSQNILQELNTLSKKNIADNIIYIVGLPDQINGAYVCRNALDGMTKYPQISKNISNCFNLSEINPIFPFGYARLSMSSSNPGLQCPQFYLWNNTEQKLQTFHLPKSAKTNLAAWSGADLKNIVTIPDQYKGMITFDQSGNLSIESSPVKNTNLRPYVILNFANRACFDIDCLVINIDSANKSTKPSMFSLIYKNDLAPDYQVANQLNWLATCGEQGQKIIFPLHSQINWAMGGTCHGIQLFLPTQSLKISRIASEAINKYMPLLSFKPSANQNVLGYIEIDQSHPSCQLNYDATSTTSADKLLLEFSPANQAFAVANDFSPPKSSLMLKELSALTGKIALNKQDFSGPGIYELRLRAFNKNNQPIGIAGDHIVVTVK